MINVNRTESVISGSVNGKPFGVTFSEEKYQEMKALETRANAAQTMEEMKEIVAEFEPYTQESYKEIVETACPFLYVNKNSNKFYLKYKDEISSKEVPQALVDRILKSVEKNIDITPLIKCWVRFLRGKQYSDRKAKLFAKYINAQYTNYGRVAELEQTEGLSNEAATRLATTPQVAITMEGLIVGYKVSKEVKERYELDEDENVVTKSRYKKSVDPDTGMVTYDEPEYVEERLFMPAVQGKGGDEFNCVGTDVKGQSYAKKGHHIRVGAAHFLDSWDQVDCNDDRSCVKGLHIGGLSYIHGYQRPGTVTHNVFVDPGDIGAVCDIDHGDGAMRVKRYFVHSSFAGVNKNIYHSSKYAAMTDEEYKASIEEVVNDTAAAKEYLDKTLEEARDLDMTV